MGLIGISEKYWLFRSYESMKVTTMAIIPRLFLFLGLSLLIIACGAVRSGAPDLSALARFPATTTSESNTPTARSLPSTSLSTTQVTAESTAENLRTIRQEADFTALPALLQQSLQTFFDTQRAILNTEQIQPITVALVPQRVALVEDWALVLLAQENAYTDGVVREEPTSTRLLRVRYLKREPSAQSAAQWGAVDQAAVPAALQAALWGPQAEKCLPTICVRYRPFGLPAIDDAMSGLNAYVEQVAADFGVAAYLPTTVTLTIEPSGSAMWQAAPAPKTFPLVSAGVWDAQQATSPTVLRQGMAEALTGYLAALTVDQSTVGEGQSRVTDRKAWPRLADALVGWTRLSYWDGLDKVTLQQRLAKNALDLPPLATLLDPQQTLPYPDGADPYLLFSAFVTEHFDAGVQAGLLQQLFTAPDWETVARQSFPVDLPTLTTLWQEWLANSASALSFVPLLYVEPFTATQSTELLGYMLAGSASTALTKTLPIAHSILPTICAPYQAATNWYDHDCAQRIEAYQLRTGIPTVERAEHQLHLTLANGTVETYTDTEGEGGGGWAFYSYINYLPELNAYLLHVAYYEGANFLLVRVDDGRKLLLTSPPVIAPDGNHFFTTFYLFENPLQLYLWRIEDGWAVPDRQLRFLPVEAFVGAPDDIHWSDAAQITLTVAPPGASAPPPATVTISLSPTITATYLGAPMQQPPLDAAQIQRENESVADVGQVAVRQPLYADRDYRFVDVPDLLLGQPSLLFNNSRMHDNSADYVHFTLYQPAMLYVAIDSAACQLPARLAACQLPAWLAGWPLSSIHIKTDDIPLNLYAKQFSAGPITLGGNEAPPAACIRSHFLLFVAPD